MGTGLNAERSKVVAAVTTSRSAAAFRPEISQPAAGADKIREDMGTRWSWHHILSVDPLSLLSPSRRASQTWSAQPTTASRHCRDHTPTSQRSVYSVGGSVSDLATSRSCGGRTHFIARCQLPPHRARSADALLRVVCCRRPGT